MPLPFLDATLPEKISYGSVFTIGYANRSVESASGWRQVNIDWQQNRTFADCKYAVNDQAVLDELGNFFNSVFGSAYSFRVRNYTDYKSNKISEGDPTFLDQIIVPAATAGQTEAQLIKNYILAGQTVPKDIVKPMTGSVILGKNGGAFLTGWSINYDTGLITFSPALAENDQITAGFLYWTPMNFQTDRLPVTLTAFKSGDVNAVLEETRLVDGGV